MVITKEFIRKNASKPVKLNLTAQANPLVKELKDISLDNWNKIVIETTFDEIFDKIQDSGKLLINEGDDDIAGGGENSTIKTLDTIESTFRNELGLKNPNDYHFVKFSNPEFLKAFGDLVGTDQMVYVKATGYEKFLEKKKYNKLLIKCSIGEIINKSVMSGSKFKTFSIAWNNLVANKLKELLLKSGTGRMGSRHDRRFLKPGQINGVEAGLKPASSEAFKFLKAIIADSKEDSYSGQVSVYYLPGEYEISEFVNDEESNIEAAGIEATNETKTFTEDEWINAFLAARTEEERSLDRTFGTPIDNAHVLQYRVREVSPNVARTIFENFWSPEKHGEFAWDEVNERVIINNFQLHGIIIPEVDVAQQTFKQVELDVYRQVFQDDGIHSPVEGSDYALSAAATDKVIEWAICLGLSPQDAKIIVENKWGDEDGLIRDGEGNLSTGYEDENPLTKLRPNSKEFLEKLRGIGGQYPVGIVYLQSQFSDESLDTLTNLRAPHSVEKLKIIRDLKISMVDGLEINNQVSDEEVNERLKFVLGEEIFISGQTWYNFIIGLNNDQEQLSNRIRQVSDAIDYCYEYRSFFELKNFSFNDELNEKDDLNDELKLLGEEEEDVVRREVITSKIGELERKIDVKKQDQTAWKKTGLNPIAEEGRISELEQAWENGWTDLTLNQSWGNREKIENIRNGGIVDYVSSGNSTSISFLIFFLISPIFSILSSAAIDRKISKTLSTWFFLCLNKSTFVVCPSTLAV